MAPKQAACGHPRRAGPDTVDSAAGAADPGTEAAGAADTEAAASGEAAADAADMADEAEGWQLCWHCNAPNSCCIMSLGEGVFCSLDCRDIWHHEHSEADHGARGWPEAWEVAADTASKPQAADTASAADAAGTTAACAADTAIAHDATAADEEWAGCLPAFGCYLCVIPLIECRASLGAFTIPPAFLGRLAAAYLQIPTWPNILVMSREAYWSICLDWQFVRHEPELSGALWADGGGAASVMFPNCDGTCCTICGWLTRNLATCASECEECDNQSICEQCRSTKDGRRLCDICIQGTALRSEAARQPKLSNLRAWRQTYALENGQALDFLSRSGIFYTQCVDFWAPSFQRTRNEEMVSDLRIFFRLWKNIAEGARDRRKHGPTQKEILAYYCPSWHRPRLAYTVGARIRSERAARASGLFLALSHSRSSRPSWLSVRGKPVGIGGQATDATATPASGLRQ